MRRLRSLVGWFCFLFLVWVVLLGTTQSTELYAGLAAAAVGSLFAEVLRARGLLDYGFAPGLVARAWRLPAMVLVDFGVLVVVLARALVQRRPIRGSFVSVPFAAGDDPSGRFAMAFAVAFSNGAANALVIDLDDDEALMHVLEPRVFTGRSVL